MSENPLSYLFNFGLSPFHRALQTASNIPVIGGLADPFLDNLDWSGVEDFEDQHPIAASGAEMLSYLLPGAAYAKVGEGLGALPALTRAAARLGGSSPAARFVLGETARWAPFNAGLTAFDYAGGNIDSPGEAVTSFLSGTALGAAGSALGAGRWAQRGLSQELTEMAGGLKPKLRLSAQVAKMFGPDDQARALYHLAPAEADSALQSEVSNWDVTDPVQLWGRRGRAILQQVQAGQRPDINLNELNGLLQTLRSEGFQERVGTGESYVRFPYPTQRRTRQIWNQEFTPGETAAKNGKREPLARAPGQGRDADTIASELQLPDGWEFLGRFFRHRTATTEAAAKAVRQRFGLTPGARAGESRRIAREINGPNGPFSQLWSIRHEDDGMWILATELPAQGKTNRFLIFKTDQPDQFFPDPAALMRDVDNPWNFGHIGNEHLGPRAWENPTTFPNKVGPYFDRMRELQDTILSPTNFRAMARQARKQGGINSRILAARLGKGTDAPGLDLGNIVETYMKPLMFQLRNSPAAAQILQMRRAAFDAANAMTQEIMFGRQALPKDKDIIAGVFGGTQAGPQPSLSSEIRRLLSDPAAREQWRKLHLEDEVPLEQWPDGPAKEFQTFAKGVNAPFSSEMNATLKAIGEEELNIHPEHVGIGHNFSVKGSNFYQVLDPNGKVVGLGVGHSAQAAKNDAQELINWRAAKGDPTDYKVGDHFTSENFHLLPKDVKEAFYTPGFYHPRNGMWGYKWQREPIENVEDLIQAFERAYSARSKHMADRVGSALTSRQYDQLLRTDPEVALLLDTRINSLKGVTGAFDKLQNRVMDAAFAKVLGVGSATKIVQKFNEVMHHFMFGFGNLAFPLGNASSIIQTTGPEALSVLSSAGDSLARHMYYLPTPGSDGRPRGSIAIPHMPGLYRDAMHELRNPSDEFRDIMERLVHAQDIGPKFIEEYMGQNASRVRALSEGVRSPEDFGRWLGAVSDFLPSNSEKLSRMSSAAVMYKAWKLRAQLRGEQYTPEQMFLNVQNGLRRSNYMYSVADRPQIFTTPLGSLFGQPKNWFMHFMNILGDYAGLAKEGNFEPIIASLGTTAALGGIMALPFAAGALDWMTETFADKDLMEYLYSNMGSGAANGIAFGAPAAFGWSMSGQTAAPGARFAHDIEFLTGVVALDRLGNAGRAIGRYYDDQYRAGIDPWSDPTFVQQAMQAFGPRTLYRAFDVYSDAALSSAKTGNPMVDDLNPFQQLQSALGFTPTEVEKEYAIYERLTRDNEERKQMIGLFGEAYFRASTAQDQTQMEEILRVATMRGLDTSSILRSAHRRAANHGVDMFGRNLPDELLARYDASLGDSE